jgi:hypothetical protein
MELNEYAVWKCKVQKMERRYIQEAMEMEYAGDERVELSLTIVAPQGALGRALLDVHFNRAFRVQKPLPSGKLWEWLDEPVEEKLNGVIRYEDAYRGRM